MCQWEYGRLDIWNGQQTELGGVDIIFLPQLDSGSSSSSSSFGVAAASTVVEPDAV